MIARTGMFDKMEALFVQGVTDPRCVAERFLIMFSLTYLKPPDPYITSGSSLY